MAEKEKLQKEDIVILVKVLKTRQLERIVKKELKKSNLVLFKIREKK